MSSPKSCAMVIFLSTRGRSGARMSRHPFRRIISEHPHGAPHPLHADGGVGCQCGRWKRVDGVQRMSSNAIRGNLR